MHDILQLPSDLTSHLAHFLDKPCILSFRLVCRRFHNDAAPAFATSFFSSVAFDFCPKSVDRLGRIAADEFLRLYVKQVIIGEPGPLGSCVHRKLDEKKPEPDLNWTRNETTQCLDTNPLANPILTSVATALSAFPNLRSLGIRDDGEPNPEPHPVSHTTLHLLDLIHIGLILASRSNLTLHAFRIIHPGRTHGYIHNLLPFTVAEYLTPNWTTHLVDLELEWYTKQDATSTNPLVEMVLQARSLRRLQLRSVPDALIRRLADDMHDSRLEILDLRRVSGLKPENLITLCSRFRTTLQHIFFKFVDLEGQSNRGWNGVLEYWAGNLESLKSFALQRVTDGAMNRRWTFDGVLEWDGKPLKGGEMVFVSHVVRPRRFGVSGIRFRGEESADVRRVLARMAIVGRPEDALNFGHVMSAEEREETMRRKPTDFESEFVVGGVRAKKVKLFREAPEVEGERYPRFLPSS
ncbi:hypothetical protein OQA88_10547 [Cercophora sp. LCS_1]